MIYSESVDKYVENLIVRTDKFCDLPFVLRFFEVEFRTGETCESARQGYTGDSF